MLKERGKASSGVVWRFIGSKLQELPPLFAMHATVGNTRR